MYIQNPLTLIMSATAASFIFLSRPVSGQQIRANADVTTLPAGGGGNPFQTLAASSAKAVNALNSVNSMRARVLAAGQQPLRPLVGDVRLDAVARQQCREFSRSNTPASLSNMRCPPGNAADRNGYRWNLISENVFSEPRQNPASSRYPRALAAWGQCQVSNSNIMNPQFTSFGYANCQSRNMFYIVTVFGKGDLNPAMQYNTAVSGRINPSTGQPQQSRNSATRSSARNPSSTIVTTVLLTLGALFATLM